MQNKIKNLLADAVNFLQDSDVLPKHEEINKLIQILRPRDKEHGDFSTNIALILAKKLSKNPRDIAESIIKALPDNDSLDKVVFAPPGFINFYLTNATLHSVIPQILEAKDKFGTANIGAGKSAIVEFVSANPTGPLHVGHGRGAAFGATCADLLQAIGFNVHREYYVNDAGRQMDILATSAWLRYLELAGENIHFPAAGYKGDYIVEIARRLHVEYKESLRRSLDDIYQDLPADEQYGGDKDFYIDALIARAKDLLGTNLYDAVLNRTLTPILADIREDLEEFGIIYQEWFSEKHLVKNGDVLKALAELREAGQLYEKDGATWFRATNFGDEKDRVVIRDNGSFTYFASDIGYHLNKFRRGFDLVIDVLGSDHHGYAPRIIAMLKALGLDATKFNVLLVQFAILWRGKTKVQMSTRSGQFVTLRELREEVGNDAARFFYIMRNNSQHLDFDLELAKSTSMDNPVYYIQYAHARICSVSREGHDKWMDLDTDLGLTNLHLLDKECEIDLISKLRRYPELIVRSALEFAPYQLAHFLQELAMLFHSYYNAEKFLIEDDKLRNARLCLCEATRQVLANGLRLLGVSTPEEM